jgi:hypothetical protein
MFVDGLVGCIGAWLGCELLDGWLVGGLAGWLVGLNVGWLIG